MHQCRCPLLYWSESNPSFDTKWILINVLCWQWNAVHILMLNEMYTRCWCFRFNMFEMTWKKVCEFHIICDVCTTLTCKIQVRSPFSAQTEFDWLHYTSCYLRPFNLLRCQGQTPKLNKEYLFIYWLLEHIYQISRPRAITDWWSWQRLSKKTLLPYIWGIGMAGDISLCEHQLIVFIYERTGVYSWMWSEYQKCLWIIQITRNTNNTTIGW